MKRTSTRSSEREEERKKGGHDAAVAAAPAAAATPFSYDECAFFVNHIASVTNRCAISLPLLISGDVQRAILFNYMIDLDWLLDQCPQLATYPRLDLVTIRDRDAGGRKQPQRDDALPNASWYTPHTPVRYGVHHSKLILLFYARGVRVVVATANFIEIDWRWKNNGVFVQDFPLKADSRDAPPSSQFESDLADYLSHYRSCGLSVSELSRFDFSGAKCVLIPSVPGVHPRKGHPQGRNMERYGHMKVRSVLAREPLPPACARSPVVCQFSSMGSISEKWLNGELRASFAAHAPAAAAAAGAAASSSSSHAAAAPSPATAASSPSSAPPIRLVWPTVSTVRSSLEGWAAGGSLCCDAKNQKPWMRSYLRVWDGLDQGRHRASPHLKSYARASADGILAWCLITSANCSNSAWGQLQVGESQLQIRHYELGALFTPSTYARAVARLVASGQQSFSCTPDSPIRRWPSGEASRAAPKVAPERVELVLLPAVDATSVHKQQQQQQARTATQPAAPSSSAAAAAATPSSRKHPRDEAVDLTDSPVSSAAPSSPRKKARSHEAAPAAAAASSSDTAAASGHSLRSSSDDSSSSASSSAASSPAASSASASASVLRVVCPLPYNLFARAYGKEDAPWVWDGDYLQADVHGNVWLDRRLKHA